MSEKNKEIEYISKDTETVKCDGGNQEFGHPAVYFKIIKNNEVTCNYCGKKFVKKN